MAEITRSFVVTFTEEELKQFIVDNFLPEFDTGFSVEDGTMEFDSEMNSVVFSFSKITEQSF